MSGLRALALLLLGAGCPFLCRSSLTAELQPPADAKPAAQIRVGMSAAEVQALLGRPKRISRQIVYRRYLEMWTYEQPSLVWVQFTCTKGQEPSVINVHPPGAARP